MLGDLFGQVLIPPAVVRELEYPTSRLPPLSITGAPFLRIQAPTDRAGVDQLMEQLESGEAEAITLALEVHAEAILIDEADGRAVAKARGLRPLGVLGILAQAKEQGLVGPLTPMLDRLQQELGFFISTELRSQFLQQVGE